jgi:hypothetical protein
MNYFRRTWGLVEPRQPDDKPEWSNLENFNPTSDSPLTVKKATYTRKPYPAFDIYIMKAKKRGEPEPDPPLLPLCSAIEEAKPGEEKKMCREDTPDGMDITKDGRNFYKKCREGFEFLIGAKKCRKSADEQYDNSEGFAEVQYYKK